jgi:hypothetical protein
MSQLEDGMSTKPTWKKGRGKLGILAPLLGNWHADATTPDGRPGKIHCERSFKKELNGSYIGLTAIWHMGAHVMRNELRGKNLNSIWIGNVT